MAQTPENRRRTDMLYNAKRRARRDGVPFDLTYEDMVWGDACPCCGVEYLSGGISTSPSIDKLIPERGYVKSNVVYVCRECNTRKNNMTPKQMYQIADFFWDRIKEAIGVGETSAGAGSSDREEV